MRGRVGLQTGFSASACVPAVMSGETLPRAYTRGVADRVTISRHWNVDGADPRDR